MSRQDRSRSPGNNEWIARAIVSMGRYPERRPKGLSVDSTGAISVRSLVDVWARQHGISEEEVLGAVQRHMFDEKRGPGALRFCINCDEAGNTTVRVHAKRGGAGLAACATPARALWRPSWQAEREQTWTEVRPRPWQWDAKQSAWQAKYTEEEKQLPDEAKQQGDAKRQKWEPTQQKWAKQTKEAKQQPAEASQPHEGKQQKWEPRQQQWEARWTPSGGGRSAAEQVQRWVGWFLKTGHRELRLGLQEGRARLADVAAALGRIRPELGVADEGSLRKLLEETDLAGRFELDDQGRVRKVPRDHRRRRSPPCSPQAGVRPVEEDPALKLAAQATATVQAAVEAAAAAAQAARAGRPLPPPGEHWKKYTDEGDLWYYYSGPLGSWWCLDADKENIMPFGQEEAGRCEAEH